MSLGGAIVSLKYTIAASGSARPAANPAMRRTVAGADQKIGASRTAKVARRKGMPSFFVHAAQPAIKPARAMSPGGLDSSDSYRHIKAIELTMNAARGTSAYSVAA